MSTCVHDTDGDGNCAACARNPEAPCRQSAGDALKIALMESVGVVQARAMVDAYAHELAEKIRARADEYRAEDWGRSNRSKRPWLMGMEAARKAITPDVTTP